MVIASCPIETMFQSTLPRGERQKEFKQDSATIKFQSTLPRGERLIRASFIGFNDHVSIHAPARGATSSYRKNII